MCARANGDTSLRSTSPKTSCRELCISEPGFLSSKKKPLPFFVFSSRKNGLSAAFTTVILTPVRPGLATSLTVVQPCTWPPSVSQTPDTHRGPTPRPSTSLGRINQAMGGRLPQCLPLRSPKQCPAPRPLILFLPSLLSALTTAPERPLKRCSRRPCRGRTGAQLFPCFVRRSHRTTPLASTMRYPRRTHVVQAACGPSKNFPSRSGF